MTRQWQPGDVAMVTGPLGGRYAAINCHDKWCAGVTVLRGDEVQDVRPLVVIDPEDREAARRLLETYGRQFTDWTPELDNNVTRLQAALREFADPTPPGLDEPSGRYAVVEDVEAREWVHADTHGAAQWKCLTSPRWAEWDDIDAVRVLSEGVTP